MFAVLICTVIVITVTGTIASKILHPEMDVQRVSETINNMTSTIIGALVGFISGRAHGRNEANANH